MIPSVIVSITSTSTFSITLQGITPNPEADTDLLVASKIYVDLSSSTNQLAVSEWISDTKSIPNRWDRISNDNQWITISNWKAQSLWPLQFVITNDPISDRAHFQFYHNATSTLGVDYPLNGALATNQPLDFYILGDSVHEQFTVSSFEMSLYHNNHESTTMHPLSSTTSNAQNVQIINTANSDSMDKDQIHRITTSTVRLSPNSTNFVTESIIDVSNTLHPGSVGPGYSVHSELTGLIYGAVALILIIAASVLLLILCFWSGKWMDFKPKYPLNVVYVNKTDVPRDMALSTGSKSNSAGDETIDSTQSSDLSVMYDPTIRETPNGLHIMALNGSLDSKLFPVGIVDQDSECELVIEERIRANRYWNERNGGNAILEQHNLYETSYLSKSRQFGIDGSVTSVDGCFGSKFERDYVLEGVYAASTGQPLRYLVEEEQPGDGTEMENDGVLLMDDDFIVPTSRGPSMCQ